MIGHHLELPEFPHSLIDLLCAAGANGDYGIFERNDGWCIVWRNPPGQERALAGRTRDDAITLMARFLVKSGHSIRAFAHEVEAASRPSETCYGVYYTHVRDGWRLAGQFRTADMADELVANMVIDTIGKKFDAPKIKRVELPVRYGCAPQTLPRYRSQGRDGAVGETPEAGCRPTHCKWERASDVGRHMRREEPIGTDPDLVLFTAPDMDRFLRVPADELNEMIRSGRIRGGFRLGRYWRFRRPVIEQFIREQGI